MKKLLSGKFLFILAACLLVLIGLGVGAFFLFDDADAKFIKSGYVLNPLSEASEKYFFEKDTGYRQNLSSMVEFVDIDKKEVSILADSFLHYNDESMSFLKNGAILDLNSIDGNEAVKFYNISNASVIEKDGNKYLIKSRNGDIVIENFIGRINENKYIIAGDLQLKLTGNNNTIEGSYFEIVYVEEGVVNIENKDVKYQVMAEGTNVRVGKDIIIELGDKKIVSDDEDIMSLTAITIDGNENIEIIPNPEVEEKPDGEGNGTGGGNGDGDGTGTGTNGEGGAGEGQGGTGQQGNKPVENVKEIIVTLKDAKIGSTNINVTFDIQNAKEQDNFSLQVINLSTGRTVDMVASVIPDAEIKVNLLSPNTKYLFTVVNNHDSNKYFQKIFETSGFGIKLEKAYATEESLAYKVTIDSGTDITNAKLTLYQYNEETKQNEVVTTSYYDSEKQETVEIPKITNLSSTEGNIEGEYEIIYDGLESDTIYTAVLDEFSVASSNFKDIYNITLTSMTLKKTPTFTKMSPVENPGAGSFELSLGEVKDPDNAIQKYTYIIYNKYNDEIAIDPVVKTNASPLVVKIGNGEGQLSNDTNYYYKVIIEYFDNEKYIEYITSQSINFMMGSDPFITVAPNDDEISYDSIGGTIYLTDNSCLVSSTGREFCDAPSTARLIVRTTDSLGNVVIAHQSVIEFIETTADDGTKTVKQDFYLDGLQQGTSYEISVEAILNNDEQKKYQVVEHSGESTVQITTKTLASFVVNWNTDDYPSDSEHVVNAGAQFVVDEEKNDGTLTADETAASIKQVVLELYEGANTSGQGTPIATKTLLNTEGLNIKDAIYTNMYNITSDITFGKSIEDLKAWNQDGKLTEFYTVVVNAYYDEEKLDSKKIPLTNNIIVYEINKFLLLDNIDAPTCEVEEITHGNNMSLFKNLKDTKTIIGYNLSIGFDRGGLLQNEMTPQKVHFYVYNANKKRVKFHILNEDNLLQLVDVYTIDITDSENLIEMYNQKIYIDYGTDYYHGDTIMSRGNKYQVGFEIEVASEGKNEMYPQVGPGKFDNYKLVESKKEAPKLTMYIAKSTANSITYNYNIIDPDNTIFKESNSETYNMYYKVSKIKINNDPTPEEKPEEKPEENPGGEIPEETTPDDSVIKEPVPENTPGTIDMAGLPEKTLPLTKVEDETGVTHFTGSVTIPELVKNDYYTLYHKQARTKTGDRPTDVLDYLEESEDGVRIFEGYYDAKEQNAEGESLYNFKYQIINNQLVDNKVTIKVLATQDMLNRIVAYKVNFKDSKGNTLEKELWQLDYCGESETIKRCLAVNYTDLKDAGMKSEQDKENVISVTVNALYDNGLTGYDYKIGTDYEYMIFQNNHTSSGFGKYISYSTAGKPTAWSEDLLSPKGYYTYTLNGSRITYRSHSKINSYSSFINFSETSIGRKNNNYGILNPKMISQDTMTSDNNTFSFSSITPKVYTETKTNLINGAKVNLRLSGVDLNDVYNEGDKSHPEYYLYVDIWSEEPLAGNLNQTARPTVKAKIDHEHPETAVVALLDGLLPGKTYYYHVYAKMYKNNKVEYIQLFDARYLDRYETRTYNFKTKGADNVFNSLGTSANVSNEVYGNRSLTTLIKLSPYTDNKKSEEPFNFDLIYVLCEKDDLTCGINENETNIFMKKFTETELNNPEKGLQKVDELRVLTDTEDISKYDLEYDKEYTLKIYARATYYPSSASNSKTTQDIFLNSTSRYIKFDALRKPDYRVTREAIITDKGEYAIDFTIVVNDIQKTLVNGEYFIKLVDFSTGEVVGKMQLLDDDGNYYNVDNYTKQPFDAFVTNKKVRITNLKPDTKYSLIIDSKAYLNNYVESEKELSKEEKREKRTIAIEKSSAVYTATDYGVAFGRDLLFSGANNSITVTFVGGSSFENVTKVRYTVLLASNPTTGPLTTETTYDLEKNTNKKFELYSNSEDWRFVIDPAGLTLEKNITYILNLSFEVKKDEETRIWITSAENEKFEQLFENATKQ